MIAPLKVLRAEGRERVFSQVGNPLKSMGYAKPIDSKGRGYADRLRRLSAISFSAEDVRAAEADAGGTTAGVGTTTGAAGVLPVSAAPASVDAATAVADTD